MKLINIVLLLRVSFSCCRDGPAGFINNTTDTPIDGGVTLLIAGAVTYGAKKLHARKKLKAEQNDNK